VFSDLLKKDILQLPSVLQPTTRDSNYLPPCSRLGIFYRGLWRVHSKNWVWLFQDKIVISDEKLICLRGQAASYVIAYVEALFLPFVLAFVTRPYPSKLWRTVSVLGDSSEFPVL
jgi:hypothetical protein